jgi:hypothetical protein
VVAEAPQQLEYARPARVVSNVIADQIQMAHGDGNGDDRCSLTTASDSRILNLKSLCDVEWIRLRPQGLIIFCPSQNTHARPSRPELVSGLSDVSPYRCAHRGVTRRNCLIPMLDCLRYRLADATRHFEGPVSLRRGGRRSR